MPVVIKELIIRAQVNNAPQAARRPPATRETLPRARKEALVEECVEAVLEVLRQKDER